MSVRRWVSNNISRGRKSRVVSGRERAVADAGRSDDPVTAGVNALDLNADVLLDLARARMVFGNYQRRPLMHLPEPYLVWFARTGCRVRPGRARSAAPAVLRSGRPPRRGELRAWTTTRW